MYRYNACLWNEFLSGDFNAYKKIYDENIDILFLFGMQFTDQRELVKDCIQDIFIALYNRSAELGPNCRYRAYLFSSLRNSIFNNLRKNANLEKYYGTLNPEHDRNLSPEDDLIIREEESILRGKVDTLLTSLTPRQREVLFYRFIESMSVDQIAFIMQLEKQSVQNLIQRAIKKIRQ